MRLLEVYLFIKEMWSYSRISGMWGFGHNASENSKVVTTV